MITCKGGQLCKEWELLGAQDRRSLQPWINEGQGLAEPFVPHCAEDFGELCQLFRFFHLNDWDARVYEQAGNKSYILEYLRWATSWLYKLRLNLFTLECTSIDLVRKDPLYQHFCLFIPPSTCAVILQSLRITSTVSMQLRNMKYHTKYVCNITQFDNLIGKFHKKYCCACEWVGVDGGGVGGKESNQNLSDQVWLGCYRGWAQAHGKYLQVALL